MKIVIDISDEGYDWIKNGFPDNEDKEFLIKAVKNGTVIAPTVEPEKAKVGELIDAYTKGFDTGVEIARAERPQGEYEYTEEDIKETIKENFNLGYAMAKNKYERPQGEWIFLKANEEQTDGYKCSVCKATYHTKVPYFSEFNFCPNCGAVMQKGGTE